MSIDEFIIFLILDKPSICYKNHNTETILIVGFVVFEFFSFLYHNIN